MSPDIITNAMAHLVQFNLSAIYAVTVEDGVLKVIAANKDGFVIEYLWNGGGWQ